MHCNRDRLRTLLSPFHTAKTHSGRGGITLSLKIMDSAFHPIPNRRRSYRTLQRGGEGAYFGRRLDECAQRIDSARIATLVNYAR